MLEDDVQEKLHALSLVQSRHVVEGAEAFRVPAQRTSGDHPQRGHVAALDKDAQPFLVALGRRVGLIVDLTQHDCLYAEELEQTPWVRYVHLATPAKRFVEPWLVRKLADEARDLWEAKRARRRWIPSFSAGSFWFRSTSISFVRELSSRLKLSVSPSESAAE